MPALWNDAVTATSGALGRVSKPATITAESRPSAAGDPSLKPAAEVPGPRLPGLLQSWLGVVRPVETRLIVRKRYGPLFRTDDALAGELFHVADRGLVEQMFKWKPAQYNVGRAARGDGARHRALVDPPARRGASPAHAQADAAAVPRRRDRALRRRDRADHEPRDRRLAPGPDDPHPQRGAGRHNGGDHPRGLRHHRPRAHRRAQAPAAPAVVASPFLLLVQKDLGPRSPWGRFSATRDRVDALLYDEIEQPPRGPRPRAAQGHPDAAARRPRRGRASRSPTASCATS